MKQMKNVCSAFPHIQHNFQRAHEWFFHDDKIQVYSGWIPPFFTAIHEKAFLRTTTNKIRNLIALKFFNFPIDAFASNKNELE